MFVHQVCVLSLLQKVLQKMFLRISHIKVEYGICTDDSSHVEPMDASIRRTIGQAYFK